MADLDFDLDSPQPKDFYWDNFVGLCAEVRRLRAIEDAARNLQDQRADCDEAVEPLLACRERWPDSPEYWCATCALVHALEADR